PSGSVCPSASRLFSLAGAFIASQKKPGGCPPRPSDFLRKSHLLHRVSDGVERVANRGAETAHGSDGGDRDQGGNEAIFNGSCGLLVLHELLDERHQIILPVVITAAYWLGAASL